MQTVLQELISELKSIESYDLIVQGIIKRAEFKLEKEKEQIVKAFASGWNWNSDPEKYYQETYVQEEDKTFKQKSKWTSVDNTKQHIIDIMKADEDDGLYKTFDTDPDKKH
jgi:hypothetical protein